jgi:hypothetical protein
VGVRLGDCRHLWFLTHQSTGLVTHSVVLERVTNQQSPNESDLRNAIILPND